MTVEERSLEEADPLELLEVFTVGLFDECCVCRASESQRPERTKLCVLLRYQEPDPKGSEKGTEIFSPMLSSMIQHVHYLTPSLQFTLTM